MASLAVAGWYGKIPALGDFAARHLAPDFIGQWDEWLQRGIAASGLSKKEHLTTPIPNGLPWRFALMPGVCGNQAWVGVMLPSVDKIGRHFPLTIALALTPHADIIRTIFEPQDWYCAVEQVALSSQDGQCLPDDLERQLSAHPFPDYSAGGDKQLTQQLSTWWQRHQHQPLILTLPVGARVYDELADAGLQLLARTGLGRSIWWQQAVDGTLLLRAFAGLPPDHCFATLFNAAACSSQQTC
jgi:type VI secretion system protein ImpM